MRAPLMLWRDRAPTAFPGKSEYEYARLKPPTTNGRDTRQCTQQIPAAPAGKRATYAPKSLVHFRAHADTYQRERRLVLPVWILLRHSCGLLALCLLLRWRTGPAASAS